MSPIQTLAIVALFFLLGNHSVQAQSNHDSKNLYNNITNNLFLQQLHENSSSVLANSHLTAIQQEILFDYAASNTSPEIKAYLQDCIVVQKNKSIKCLFAYSQQKDIDLMQIKPAVELNQEYEDNWKSLLGKCLGNEAEASIFSAIEMSEMAFCQGAFYCLRNGQWAEALSNRLIGILKFQFQHQQDISDVCRAMKSIPSNHFPVLVIDSLIDIAPIEFWNNRMAIQMLGKSKSPKAIQTIVKTACLIETADTIVMECLIQLQRQKEFPTETIQSLLTHPNHEIVGMTIDCLALQKQFQIPVSQIISRHYNGKKNLPSELLWKIKSFEIQNPICSETVVLDAWNTFLHESNPYHRMLAFDAIKKAPSLFQPILQFIQQSTEFTDLYYGTICLISMSEKQNSNEWISLLWEKNDEGIDALLYEYLREKISDPIKQQQWKVKIAQRMAQYEMPKMVETRNEALMTLEKWGEILSVEKNFPSGLRWTPEELRVLPEVISFEMITLHDAMPDTIRFQVHKDGTPLTALHFSKLVNAHFYDHKYFHRRVSNFVLQGGCPRGDGMGSLDYTITSEFSPEHFLAGQIGWASAGPHTESCQIFFMLDEAYHLDGRYTNMGHITSGLEKLKTLPLGTEIVSIRQLN